MASEYDIDDEIDARMEACDTFKAKALREKCLQDIANHLSPTGDKKKRPKQTRYNPKKHCRFLLDKEKRFECYGLTNKRPKAGQHRSDAYQLVTRAIAVIKMKPNWERLEIKRASNADYSIVIWYKFTPRGAEVVEVDTKLVARAILNEIIASGIDPKKSYVGVYVRGYKKNAGLSNSRRISRFGRTHYDFKSGQFIFDAHAR